jgi:hypothetical protein
MVYHCVGNSYNFIESPSKNHFAKKIEFLVQLSQRTLKLATKAPEDAKKTKKPIPSKNGKPSPPL